MSYDPTPGDTVRVPNMGTALVVRRADTDHIVVRRINGEHILARIADVSRVEAEEATLNVNTLTVDEP